MSDKPAELVFTFTGTMAEFRKMLRVLCATLDEDAEDEKIQEALGVVNS